MSNLKFLPMKTDEILDYVGHGGLLVFGIVTAITVVIVMWDALQYVFTTLS